MSVFNALSLLTPYDVDTPKIRIGPKTDGGYVLLDRFEMGQPVLSYGISTEFRFDIEMAERGHYVYMFDHTIDEPRLPNDRMFFFREGISGSSRPSAKLFTLEDHLLNCGVEGDRNILKIDVEGAEFDVFLKASPRVLGRFEQIILEVHGLSHLDNDAFRSTFVKVFSKLNSQFVLHHVHANNCDGPNGFHIVDGFVVSHLLELSYVRADLVVRRPSKTVYPTELDYPCVNKREKVLFFFPFFPTTLTHEELRRCMNRVENLSNRELQK